MQAFAFNIRRDKFKDPRVRLAFNYAFDFHGAEQAAVLRPVQTHHQLFRGHRTRGDRACRRAASSNLLETVRDKVPAELFKKPYTNPASGDRAVRNNHARGAQAVPRGRLRGAQNQQLVNAKTSEPFTVELLANAPLFERIFLFYKPALERLGITVSVRTVDEAQYENRLRGWDFDIIVYAWGESLLPGNELRGFFGSQAADQPGPKTSSASRTRRSTP